MAYRYDKNLNNQYDLILDGWENGIAPSPFKGVGNIRNLNIKYYDGVAYVNYKRKPCTISGGTMAKPLYATKSPAGIIYISDDNRQIWKQSAVNGSTFALLTGNYNQPIDGIQFWNNYLLVFGGDINGRIEICGDGSGDAGVTSSNWNSPSQTPVTFTVTIASPAVFTTASPHGLVAGDNLRFTTTGALPTGLSINTNYYVISAGLTSTTFQVSTTVGGSAVNTSGTQSGVHSYTVAYGLWPIPNVQPVTFTASPSGGDTSATIASYTDQGGVTRAVWNGPTGFYNLSFLLANGTSQTVLANFITGSNAVVWTPPLNDGAAQTTGSVYYNGSTVTSTGIAHMSLVAANNGDLYFCNGSNIGAFTLNVNQRFNKNDMKTFTFYSNILSLPPTETSVWLTELKNQLIVLTYFRLYGWDFFSQFYGNPVPMDEQITKGINILNKLYIFAGNKGNVYQSDGYSVSRYMKMPDFVAGVVDPAWLVGGLMQHRQKPYFQMLAKNGQTGTNILSGIFSIDLDTNALIMENQNSEGLNPAGMVAAGILVDNPSIAVNYDNYYSAYGATTSSIDFNDTTLYSAGEAVIETDIVPIGTALQLRTFGSAEFKLDQPLQSGDSISLYARESLSASYQLIGTTTTAVLSEGFQKLPFQNWQWVQFKVEMTCNATATSSSFNRLREIRIR